MKSQNFIAGLDDLINMNRRCENDYIYINAEYQKKDVQVCRKIFMSDLTTNIRGEDTILMDDRGCVAVRFILSPDIEVIPDTKTSKNLTLKLSASNVKTTQKIARITTLQFSASGCYDLIYQKSEDDFPHSIILLANVESGKFVNLKWTFNLNG